MSAYTDAQRAEAIALVEGCVLVSEVRARLLPVIGQRDAALALAGGLELALASTERERDTARGLAAVHRLKMEAAERERDAALCLLLDLVVACGDHALADSPAWREARAHVTGARVSRG